MTLMVLLKAIYALGDGPSSYCNRCPGRRGVHGVPLEAVRLRILTIKLDRSV